MINLIVGKKNCGKSSLIKSKMESFQKPIIIFDYKDKYKEFSTLNIELCNVDPFTPPLSLEQCCAINSGLIEYSQFLYKRCEEVYDDFSQDVLSNSNSTINIISEALNRSLNGWEPTENDIARSKKRFLIFPSSKDTTSLVSQLELIRNSDIVTISSSAMHSTKTRILTFLILLFLQDNFEKYTIISDNINYLWNEGHIFHFKDVYDFSKANFILSLNKTETIPKHFKPLIHKAHIFKLETNYDINFFQSLGINLTIGAKRQKRGDFMEFNLFDVEPIADTGVVLDINSDFEVKNVPIKLKETPIGASDNLKQLAFDF